MASSDNVMGPAQDITLQNNVLAGAIALNGVAWLIGGAQSVTIEVTGTNFAATVIPEGWVNSRWDQLLSINLQTGQVIPLGQSITAVGKYLVPTPNIGQFRARIGAIPSGSCNVDAKASASDPPYVLMVSPGSTATPQPGNLQQIGGVALALGAAPVASCVPVTLASNQPGIAVNIVGGLAVASAASPMPVTDAAIEVFAGTVNDPAAVRTDSDTAGSLIAQMRGVVKQLALFNEIFRGWAAAQRRTEQAIARLLSTQVGAFLPLGGDDDTDGLGGDLTTTG